MASDRSSVRRRAFLRQSVILAALPVLAGCTLPPFASLQRSRVPRIGFLATGTAEGRAFLVDGFLKGLHEHGYTEGQDILIEYRFSGDRNDQLVALATELVNLPVDLIVTSGVPASVAAKQATSTVPLVLGGVAGDPIEMGLVESLAHPGGNVTGMSQMSSQLGGKRLEVFKAMVPGLSRVGVFWNRSNPAYGPVMKELDAAAPALDVEILPLEVRVPGDFEGAFEDAARQQAQALIMPGDPLTTNRPRVVADLARQYRLPAMMEYRVFVDAGGLIALGADIADLYRRSAVYVEKILKGASPADLPVDQTTKIDLIVNLSAAQAIGLVIPPSVLTQATEIIQ